MTSEEWESLCDGCGRCCLVKMIDEESERVYYTDIGCDLLDPKTGKCSDYCNRLDRVAECELLTPDKIGEHNGLPPTCGYRLVAEGKDLYWWHPLVSGDPDTVRAAGISVAGRVHGPEATAGDPVDRIKFWPERVPKKAQKRHNSA